MTQNINILQWNLNGFFKKYNELQLIIQNQKPNIICLQETNFNDKLIGKIPNFISYSKNRTNALRSSGGVAIYISENFYSKQIPLNSNLEAIAIKVHGKEIFTICNIYIPNQTCFNKNDILSIIKQLPSPYIITGDFNSHNIIWGSLSTDNRGKEIEEILKDDNITLLNTGENTRLNPHNGNFSAIDLSFSNAALAQRLSWIVDSQIYSSDHFPIFISIIPRQNEFRNNIHPRWNLKNPNWDLYTDMLEKEIQILSSTSIYSTPEQLVENFTNIIINTAEKTIGRSSYYPKPQVPWWNEHIKISIKQKNSALNKYKKTKNIDDFISFKKLRAKTKYLIKKSKTLSWQEFTSKLNLAIDPPSVWNKIKSLKGLKRNNQINLLDSETKTTIPTSEIPRRFGEYFQKNSNNTNYNTEFRKKKYITENTQFFSEVNPNDHTQIQLNEDITINELLHSLKKCNSKSSGPDNIPYLFLHHLPPNGKTFLCYIYNVLWKNNFFPENWRNSRIIPIPKPNKNKFQVEGYRPISLLNNLCKLLEKIVNYRLIWYLEKINYLATYQNGFRKSKSTIDSLIYIQTEINNAFSENQSMGLISLDIEKAYDCTWKYRIISKLHSILCHGNLLNFIINFLQTRTFQVQIGNTTSDTYTQENGIPQGSSLSVSLFLVAINDISNTIQNPTKYTLFADDLIIFFRSKHTSTVQFFLQETINNISKWSNETGFIFSPSKSQSIYFTKNKKSIEPKFKINGLEIPNKNTMKILGIIFDKKLTWVPHIKNLKKDTTQRINIIKILAHTTWGSEAKLLIQLYKSLIRSKLEYGAEIYASAKKTILKTLDPVHNTSLRLAVGAFKSSPVESIYVIANEPPLWIRRVEIALLFTAKKYRTNTELLIPDHIKLIVNKFQLNFSNIIKYSGIQRPPWTNKTNVITELATLKKNSTAPEIYLNHFRELISDLHGQYIYTDASKCDQGVGISIILNNCPITYNLSDQCSIYTAEALAIITALKHIKKLSDQNYYILSDSLSTIHSIKNSFNLNDISTKLINKLHKLETSNKNIKFIWIPGHCSIHGNEEADKHAKKAATSIETPKLNLTTFTDQKKMIKILTSNIWQEHWRNQINKLREIKQNIVQWQSTKKSRKEEIIINRIRIGHTRLTHGYLMENGESPNCPSCGVALTVKHVLTECLQFRELREEYHLSTNLYEIVGPDSDAIQNLFMFLKTSKLDKQI